jgi:hypothetical protein
MYTDCSVLYCIKNVNFSWLNLELSNNVEESLEKSSDTGHVNSNVF